MRVVAGGPANRLFTATSGSMGRSLSWKDGDQLRPPSVLYLAQTLSRKSPLPFVPVRNWPAPLAVREALVYQLTTVLPKRSMEALGNSWKLLSGPLSMVEVVQLAPLLPERAKTMSA